jgi:hypothetical protein
MASRIPALFFSFAVAQNHVSQCHTSHISILLPSDQQVRAESQARVRANRRLGAGDPGGFEGEGAMTLRDALLLPSYHMRPSVYVCAFACVISGGFDQGGF